MIRALSAALAAIVLAAPPPDSTGENSAWFKSLAQPGTGMSCCALSDCRPVQARIQGNRWEAFIDRKTFGERAPQQWIPVQPENVIHTFSPLGEAVACWRERYTDGVRDDAFGLMCFVPPPQT